MIARRRHDYNKELRTLKEDFHSCVSVMRDDLGQKIQRAQARFEEDRQKIIGEASES